MAINLLRDRGVPLEQQRFTWRELVQAPYSKLTTTPSRGCASS